MYEVQDISGDRRPSLPSSFGIALRLLERFFIRGVFFSLVKNDSIYVSLHHRLP